MDPITVAARRFLAEMDEFWEAGQSRVLRMVVSAAEQGELVKALRLGELAPENRRPLFLYEAPFLNKKRYGDGLCDRIAGDYELLRKGVAEEGVPLAPFTTDAAMGGPGLDSIGRAVLHIERAAALLGSQLDGVLLALVPMRATSPADWRESVAMLAKAPLSPRVRLAIADPENGPLTRVLGADGAHFAIDQAKLRVFVRQLVGGPRGGAAIDAPAAADRSRELSLLLLDAAERTRQGDPKGAAELYRRAVSLCRADDRGTEEACVQMALAGAHLASGEAPAALERYREAANLGAIKGASAIVCQARLGAAGVLFGFTRYEAAAEAYEAAAEAAVRAGLPLLRIEALRMAGTCHMLCESKEEALLAWVEAMNEGLVMKRRARDVSTMPQAAQSLYELLSEMGFLKHAAEVASYLERLSAEQRGRACL